MRHNSSTIRKPTCNYHRLNSSTIRIVYHTMKVSENKLLTVVPSLSAAIALVANLAIICVVLRSKKKLKDAYRRIIFTMGIYDIAMSSSAVFRIFRKVPDEDRAWGALGNEASAKCLASMMLFGMIGSQLYNVALSVYYLCVIKYNYRDKKFRKNVEPYIHGFIFLFSTASVVTVLATKSFNPGAGGRDYYWIASYPLNCRTDEHTTCLRGKHATMLKILFTGVPLVGAAVANVLIMVMIWWTVKSQERRMNQYRIRRVSMNIANTLRNRNGNAATTDPTPGGVLDLALAARRNRRTPTVTRSRDFLRQAALYFAAFLVCFSGTIVVQFMIIYGKLDNVPFGVFLFNLTVRPLQGCLNILIYTRPHVKNARMQDQSLTYFQGLKTVILSGCDDDEEEVGNNSNRRQSLRGTAAARANTPSDRTTQAQGNRSLLNRIQQATGSFLSKALQLSKTPQSTTDDATKSRPGNLDEEMGDSNDGESLLRTLMKIENSNDGDEDSVEIEAQTTTDVTLPCEVAGTDGNSSNSKNVS